MNAARQFRDYRASLFVALPIIAGLAWTLPRASRPPLAEAAVWSLVVVAAFAGWGSLVAFAVAAKERVDLGLRIAWGASAMLFVGGLLTVPSLMTRSAVLMLVDVGVALAVAALFRERVALQRWLRLAVRCGRRQPRFVLLVGIVSAVLAVHYLAGIAEWHTNPYDDDIAYLSFVKKLHDTGSFPEPFSFRRLAALGGQTLFVALVNVRAAPHQAHTFDRSICILLLALLVVGHRARGRRPSVLFIVATVLLVPTLPVIAINTASHFSAVAFFVALFRTVVWAENRSGRSPASLDGVQPGDTPASSGDTPAPPEGAGEGRPALNTERPSWCSALPIALLAATVCTLRQNYLPIPACFLAASYFARIHARRSRGGLRKELVEPAWCAVFFVAALSPWLVAAWQSNGTFLYPVMLGTFNRALILQSTSTTLVHELRLFVTTLLEGVPLPSIGLFVLTIFFLKERGDRRPLLAFFIAVGAGFALLVHALSQGDAGNLGRYACGFVVALAVATCLTAGLERWSPSPTRSQIAAAIALAAVLLQLFRSGETISKFYSRAFRNIDAAQAEPARSDRVRSVRAEAYARLQFAVPAGERLAVLVDEPHWLDFRRNPIWNLDMPGYSSLPPGMPYFLGSERVEAYLKQIGVRYVAFVRPDHSSYHYRREYWLMLLVDEMEVWRAFAPYVIDFLDNLVDMAGRHRHLYDGDGMIVMDLAEGGPP